MGIFVEVTKLGEEGEDFVCYAYQFSILGEEYKSASGKLRYKLKEVCGKLKLDKRNSNIHIVELAEGDKGGYANRAILALLRHWKLGEYPDKTYWQS